jgi:cell division protease FtsH
MTVPELKDKIAALLGGRAAEELFVGEVSTGASNDLQQATDIARAMVREYGMSDTIGPVSLGDSRRSAFLQQPGQVGEMRSTSEHVRRQVDSEVQRLVQEGLDLARRMVREHREKLESIAARLMQQEVVEEEEIERVLGPKAGDHPRDEPTEVVAPPPATIVRVGASTTEST